MRRLLIIGSIVLVFFGFVTSTVSANSTVAFTWTVTDLGQGCWGGGTLNANGTGSGGGNCSFANGQVVMKIVPVSWSMVGSGAVLLCANMVFVKGGSGSSFGCLGPIPITGTPVKVTLPGGDGQTLIRITPVGR